jgi:hypothetical protein
MEEFPKRKIWLLWPTARPQVFKATRAHWMAKCSDPSRVETVAAVPRYASTNQAFDGIRTVACPWKAGGAAKALYTLTYRMEEVAPRDIVVVPSDDFFPPGGWDLWLDKVFHSFSGGLSVDDGINGENGGRGRFATLPIMDGETFRLLNRIIYHPAYNHNESDRELVDNLKALGRFMLVPDSAGVVFRHEHWLVAGRRRDDLDRFVAEKAAEDRETYARRSRMPLERRLEGPEPGAWDCPEALGPVRRFPMAQMQGAEAAILPLLEDIPFDHVVELGTGAGGLSLWFHDHGLRLKYDFCTFDIKDCTEDLARRRGYVPFKQYLADVCKAEGRHIVSDLLARPGRTLLFMDAGPRPLVGDIYLPRLRDGDVALAHDYMAHGGGGCLIRLEDFTRNGFVPVEGHHGRLETYILGCFERGTP